MNITIFGANGAIGRIVTGHALDHGDTVTAYVRSANGLDRSRANFIIMVGDLSNRLLIEKAIENADVVISALGPALDTSRKKGTPIADGHAVIIHAMERLDKKRFITLATPTVRSDEDRIRISTVLPPIIARVLFPNPYREMKIIEEIVKKSSLEWTVVRMIKPGKKQKDGGYGISLGDMPAKMGVSRENVGAFMYRVASENSYIRKMPIIFNK